jgi:hypothetical protein
LAHISGGDTGLAESWVYCEGMMPPSAKAGLIRVMGGDVGAPAGAAGAWAMAAGAETDRITAQMAMNEIPRITFVLPRYQS